MIIKTVGSAEKCFYEDRPHVLPGGLLTLIHPFPESESESHIRSLAGPARLAALADMGLMDSLPEEAFDRVVRLATQVAGVPVGLFSLVDDQRQFFKARAGLEGPNAAIRETPLNSSFCQYVVTSDKALAVSDARIHPLLADNAAIAGLNVIAYLGVPIHAPGGQVLGSLCAIDHVPHEWTERQAAALRDLASIIETELALRQSMEDRALILTELNHRVKNLFAMVGGMVRLARREHDDPTALAADIEGRVNALARAHQLIVPSAALNGGGAAGAPLGDLLISLLSLYDFAEGVGRVISKGPEVDLGPQATTSLALAFHELATNSVKYGALSSPEGQLLLNWSLLGGDLHLQWDELAGAPAMTTANEVQAHGAGFGSQLLEMTIEGQLRGRIETQPNGTGLRHQITIPAEALKR